MVANCLMQTNDIENVAGTWQAHSAVWQHHHHHLWALSEVAGRVAESAARSLKVPQITHANWLCCYARLQRDFNAVFSLQSPVCCLPPPTPPSVVFPLAYSHDLHMHISQ